MPDRDVNDAGRIASSATGSQAALFLEALRTPAFVIERCGRVVEANGHARGLLDSGRSLVTLCEGRLRFGCARSNGELYGFVESFYRGTAGYAGRFVAPSMMLRLRRTGPGKHVVLSMRVPAQLWHVTAKRAAEVFDLPPMQAKLVVTVVNGGTLDEFGREWSISKRTAKWHMSLLLRKFEARSQIELVRKLCILMM